MEVDRRRRISRKRRRRRKSLPWVSVSPILREVPWFEPSKIGYGKIFSMPTFNINHILLKRKSMYTYQKFNFI